MFRVHTLDNAASRVRSTVFTDPSEPFGPVVTRRWGGGSDQLGVGFLFKLVAPDEQRPALTRPPARGVGENGTNQKPQVNRAQATAAQVKMAQAGTGERERDRQTDRQRQRQRNRDRETEAESQT